MIDISNLARLAKERRQEHLQLSEPCLERGGVSTQHKGVLAQFLDTAIPKREMLLCHACHNASCSNPKHLYWGTYSENLEDAISNGRKPIWQLLVEKYGLEEACRRNGLGDKVKGGKANKGKVTPTGTRTKISRARKRAWNKHRLMVQ